MSKRFAITGTDGSGKSTVIRSLKAIKPKDWLILEYPEFYIDPSLPHKEIGKIIVRIANLGDDHARVDWKALGLFLSMQLYGIVEDYCLRERSPAILITERQAVIDSLVYGSLYKSKLLANQATKNAPTLEVHLSGADIQALKTWIDDIFSPFGWQKSAPLGDFFAYMLDFFSQPFPILFQKLCALYRTSPCDHLILLTVDGASLERRLADRKQAQTLNEMHENLGTLLELQKAYKRVIKELGSAGLLAKSTVFSSDSNEPDDLAERISTLVVMGSPDNDSGAKAFHLQELAGAGFRVPDGFVLKNKQETANISEASIASLGGFPVAVRSSALDEDGMEQSFAGQFESFLNISDMVALQRAVHDCFASYDSERAKKYRKEKSVGDTGMRVLIQKMVEAQSAGVAFSLHPTTGDEKTILIEAVPGLGDVLVGGEVNPSRYACSVFSPDAYSQEAGDGDFFLSKDQVKEVTELTLRVQAFYGIPQDIEWAFDKHGKLFLLQSRPITHIPRKQVADMFTNADFKDGGVSARPCTPMMASLYESVFADTLPEYLHSIGLLKNSEKEKSIWISEHYGRLYWNASAVKRCLERIPGFDETQFDRNLGVTCDYGDKGPTKTAWSLKGVIIAIPVLVKLYRGFDKIFRNLEIWRQDFRVQEELLRKVLNANPGSKHSELIATLNQALNFHHIIESRYFNIVYNNSNIQSELDNSLSKLKTRVSKHQLLQGLSGVIHLQVQKDLYDLCKVLEKHGIDSQAYQNSFQLFLDKHYHCGDAELDLLQPRWRESPQVLQDKITAMLRHPEQLRDPVPLTEAQFQEHQATLQSNPLLKSRAFMKLLTKAREFLRIREEFRVYSSKSYALIRAILNQLGKHCELDQDIFFLRYNELEALKNHDISSDLKKEIERRKLYYQGLRNYSPPNELGGNLIESSLENIASDSLRGLACSQGRVTGIARVIHDPNQFDRLGKGEILVTKFTDPGWTPLLGVAAAVITEVGGLLSHAAVISREFGIPAVLNVNRATTLIQDGQMITVDGGAGTIFLN